MFGWSEIVSLLLFSLSFKPTPLKELMMVLSSPIALEPSDEWIPLLFLCRVCEIAWNEPWSSPYFFILTWPWDILHHGIKDGYILGVWELGFFLFKVHPLSYEFSSIKQINGWFMGGKMRVLTLYPCFKNFSFLWLYLICLSPLHMTLGGWLTSQIKP